MVGSAGLGSAPRELTMSGAANWGGLEGTLVMLAAPTRGPLPGDPAGPTARLDGAKTHGVQRGRG